MSNSDVPPQITNLPQQPGEQVGLCVTLDPVGAVAYLVLSDIDYTVRLDEVQRWILRDAVQCARFDRGFTDELSETAWLSDFCVRITDQDIHGGVFANAVIRNYDRLAHKRSADLRDLQMHLVHCICASLTERGCTMAQSRLLEARSL